MIQTKLNFPVQARAAVVPGPPRPIELKERLVQSKIAFPVVPAVTPRFRDASVPTFEEKRPRFSMSQEQLLDNRLFYEQLWSKLHVMYPPSFFVDSSYVAALRAMWLLFHNAWLDVQLENLTAHLIRTGAIVQSTVPISNDESGRNILNQLEAKLELDVITAVLSKFLTQLDRSNLTIKSATDVALGIEQIINWQRGLKMRMTDQWFRCMANVGIPLPVIDEMKSKRGLDNEFVLLKLDKYIRQQTLQSTQLNAMLAQEAANAKPVLTNLLTAVADRRAKEEKEKQDDVWSWNEPTSTPSSPPQEIVLNEMTVDEATALVASTDRPQLRDKLLFLKSAKRDVALPPVYQRYMWPDGRFQFPKIFESFLKGLRVGPPFPHLPQVGYSIIATLERCITLESLDPFSRDIQNLLQIPASKWQSMRVQMVAKVDRWLEEIKSTPEWDQIIQRFHQAFPPTNRLPVTYMVPLIQSIDDWVTHLNEKDIPRFMKEIKTCFESIYGEVEKKTNDPWKRPMKLAAKRATKGMGEKYPTAGSNWNFMEDVGDIALVISSYFASSIPEEKRYVPIEPFYWSRKEEGGNKVDLTDYAAAMEIELDDEDDADENDFPHTWKFVTQGEFPADRTIPVHIESVRFVQALERCISRISVNGFSMATSIPLRNYMVGLVEMIEKENTIHKERLAAKEAEREKALTAETESTDRKYREQMQSDRARALGQTGALFPVVPPAFRGIRSRPVAPIGAIGAIGMDIALAEAPSGPAMPMMPLPGPAPMMPLPVPVPLPSGAVAMQIGGRAMQIGGRAKAPRYRWMQFVRPPLSLLIRQHTSIY